MADFFSAKINKIDAVFFVGFKHHSPQQDAVCHWSPFS